MILNEIDRHGIASPSDLVTWGHHLESLNLQSGPMLFRGQSQVHTNLMPTLGRSLQEGAYDLAMLLERRLLTNFRTHYEELTSLPADMPAASVLAGQSDLDVLSLMQHYEVPSRLLDWTSSVWVAAYFACASHADKDAELWFMDSTLLDVAPDEFPLSKVRSVIAASIGGKPAEYHPLWRMPLLAVIEPASNARLRAQKGFLTASDNARVDHAGLLWRLATKRHGGERTGQSFGRHIIRAARKRDILHFLAREKGVSAKSLFPDIVGLGRFVRWEFEALRMELF